MSVVNLCQFDDPQQLLRALDTSPGATVAVEFTETSFDWALVVNGSLIFVRTFDEKPRGYIWNVPAADLRAIAERLPADQPVIAGDTGGAFTLNGTIIGTPSETPAVHARVKHPQAAPNSEDETQPSAPIASPAPVEAPKPQTRAFQIVKAAIDLSNAVFGAPRIDHDATLSAYVVYTAPSTRLHFTVGERAATTVTTSARINKAWIDLDSKRLQKIQPSELAALLVLFQQGVTS